MVAALVVQLRPNGGADRRCKDQLCPCAGHILPHHAIVVWISAHTRDAGGDVKRMRRRHIDHLKHILAALHQDRRAIHHRRVRRCLCATHGINNRHRAAGQRVASAKAHTKQNAVGWLGGHADIYDIARWHRGRCGGGCGTRGCCRLLCG